jgi:tetratricopeptide (TPR) repeat protein
MVWAFTTFDAGNWHPLTWLSHALDCQLYGLKPGGHHTTNVILHAAAAVLLFLALRRMTRRSTAALWTSAWVAAVFALHPLRIESVAWVAERKDVLSGLFFMLTLWLYARYAERPASWGRYLLVVGSFALGLMAKPMLVTLPFVLLLLDYWPLGRVGSAEQGAGSREQGAESGERGMPRLQVGASGGGESVSPGALSEPVRDCAERSRSSNPTQGPSSFRRFAPRTLPACSPLPAPSSPLSLLVEKIPLFVLAAASSAVTLFAQREAGTMRSWEQLDLAGRVANASTAYVAYLGKMFYPAGLAVLYPLSPTRPPEVEVVAAVCLLAAITAAFFVLRQNRPYLLCGWLWYLGTLVPVIGLVQVGDQALADRYTYLPQIGLAVAIAWAAAEAAGAWPSGRWALAAGGGLVLAALMAGAWQQARYWRDSETLWTRTLACTSKNPIAHDNLGSALADRGRFDAALAQYQEALKIKPDDVKAHNNLGLIFARRGDLEEAIDHYRQALEKQPDFAAAHNNLGLALADCGELPDAMAHYKRALAIKPDYAEAHNNLGLALADGEQFDAAIAEYRQALAIDPDVAETRYNLGLALAARGEAAAALAECQKALDLATARNNRALADTIRAGIEQIR